MKFALILFLCSYAADACLEPHYFPKEFKSNHIIGYSDHSIGIEMCLLAISRGATVIEKHFTLDKSDTTIRDHTLSATPNEFLQMTRIVKDIYNKLKLNI